MAEIIGTRRRLFVHPAHRVVGVSGDGAALPPYCRIADLPVRGLISAATHLVLVARRQDPDAWAAAELFDEATAQRDDVDCSRLDLATVHANPDSLADADCIVLFNRGLHIARHWSDLANTQTDDSSTEGNREQIRVELAVATCRHPVLEGVEPFMFHAVSQDIRLPQDATVLLTGSRADRSEPVAWLRHCRHGRVFHTSLGSAEHFRHPEFVQLILNGLAWVAGAK